MVVIDSSAWVEFFRNTGSPTCSEVDRLLDSEFAICDAIRMEVLAGARDTQHLVALRGALAAATQLPTTAAHYDQAAEMYRTCRRNGVTVRKMLDCLIASVAMSADVPVLHADRDFDMLASCTPLRVHRP